jgi:DNA-binding MarR family transcriptional regulator
MIAKLSPARAQRGEVAAVVDNFLALMRSFGRARARLVAAAEKDVEWSAHLLLRCIANSGGPMRAADVSGVLHSDPSTVSRQVAVLVKEGYLERRADPADGRASLLALTPAGEELLDEHNRIRLEHFARVVDDWSDADLKRFATLLDRFAKAYEAANTDWIAERLAHRPARARSKH